MADKFSTEVKQRAVAEVILGVATLTSVAERYRMSAGYLSILCSRFRRSICGEDSAKAKQRHIQRRSSTCSRESRLDSRVAKLERDVREIYQIINN